MPVRLRPVGVFTFLLGLVALLVGSFNGCGSLFTYNGRHAIEVLDVNSLGGRVVAGHADAEPSMPQGSGAKSGLRVHAFVPVAGRRYTIAVQAVFDREGLERREGLSVVEAKMPLVLRVKDGAGTVLAQVSGWLDPNEPPNVLYGQAAHESRRGPMPELIVERLVGPFLSAGTAPLSVEIDLGEDRTRTARITSRRLVIHDDALPGVIRNAFLLAAAGCVAVFAGLGMISLTIFRSRARRPARKRSGIPRGDVL